ncbi:ribonuclease H-like protein, partial [Ascodesmis nigricans]
KYYGVQTGRRPGVYETWQDCLAEVRGFKNAKFKSFPSREEAQQFVAGEDPSQDPNSSMFVQKFYGVQSGKVPGVYTDWPTAKAQVVGVVKPKVRVFLTRTEAEEFVGEGLVAPPIPATTISTTREEEETLSNTEPPSKRSRTDSSSSLSPISPISPGPTSPTLAAALASAVPPPDPQPQSPSSVLRIYTDGSALSNGRHNSRAGIGVYFGEADSRNISEPLTGPRQTNQRAELTAILRAITAAPLHRPVLIFTDSQYAIKCVTVWHQAWERNNWKNSTGKPVENRDLVESILKKIREREIEGRRRGAGMGKGGWTRFEWVKGHTGVDDGNSKADRLAVAGAR